MSLEDKWASLDKKLDGILRNQSYIIQKVLLMQSQLDQLSTAAPAKRDVPKPKEVFQGIMDKNVAFFGYIASNGQKCCSFLDRYLDNTKNYLTFALSV